MLDAPRHDDAAAVALFRESLARSGYGAQALQETLGLQGPFSRDPSEVPVYLRLLPEGEPLTGIAKLFLLRVSVDAEEAEAALAPLPLERAESMGLVERTEHGVEALVSILPWGQFMLASDPFQEDLPPTRPDHVLSLIPPSVVLAKLAPRLAGVRALDLGTGNGVQSLLCAEHASRVVATDVNERALVFARFNAALNGADSVEFRRGNTFEPIGDDDFDLILCNPPYVVSPESQYAFRDSGLPGDAFCEALVREAPRHLAEGGFAVFLVSWVHGADEPWDAPLRRWVETSGCDALLFHYMSQDPLVYAASWNRALKWDPVAYSRAIDRWLEYDRRLGIERIGWGAVILRRRAGANWIAAEALAADAIDPAGDHVLRIVQAQDFLTAVGARNGDAGRLLDERLVLAPDHRLDQSVVVREGQGLVQRAVLRLDGGFNFEVELDRSSFDFVPVLDGRPLREVLTGSTLAGPTDDALAAVRRLVELGLVVPADEVAA